jgi:hypothetical protein
MRMMNWAALSLAAGMSSCSLMATPTPLARVAIPQLAAPQPAATVVAREAAAPAANILSRSAPAPA